MTGGETTTAFPVPESGGEGNRVYVSVGHQQMMTDPLKPLGISFWQLTAARPMYEAGSRLFVDVTAELASPSTRPGLLEGFGRSDPLLRNALESVLQRPDFRLPPAEDDTPRKPPPHRPPDGPPPDPAVVAELIQQHEASLAALQRRLAATSGPAVFDVIRDDLHELRRLLSDPQSLQVILTAMRSAWWLNEHLEEWLGERNAADVLSQSVPGNVTSEMGLALLDVADVIRPHPEVVAFLRDARDEDVLDGLAALDGGREARDALAGYLDRYGMRCVGEIDITRPRWHERPTTLLPTLLSHVDRAEPGAARRRFVEGEAQARRTEEEVLDRLRTLPDGDAKAAETKETIDRLRTFSGYREQPKYAMICRYWAYKQAVLGEVRGLVAAGVLDDEDDAFFLTFDELADAVRTHRVDGALVTGRRAAFLAHHALTPPRVLTSDGGALAGGHRREDVPVGALAGLAVSAGVVEGRARVVLDMASAEVEPGDILVTSHTDPSWSPLFVAVAGLVTEVGGLMTHGAVIAREYGLPAVVGVPEATRLIPDGRWIRVDGAQGIVELLPGPAGPTGS